MNKHIIVTSFALVLTLTVVLAVGKTDGTAELNLSADMANPGPRPDTQNNVNEQILMHDISESVQDINGAVIQSEVDEGDMILGLESSVGYQKESSPVTRLMQSLMRVQEALITLERVAASTEQIIVAQEKERAAQ